MFGLFKYTPPVWCTTSNDKSKYKLCHNVCLSLFLSMFPVIIMNYVFNFHQVWVAHWVTVIVFGLLLLLFRKHVLRIEITTNLFLGAGVVFIAYSILSSDTIRSPIMPWFGIVPLFAFWLLDARYAFFWLIVSAVCYAFFLVLALNNYSPGNKYDFFSGTHAYYAVFGLLLLLINIYVIGSDFEKKKKIAIDEINQTNNELVEALTDLKKAKEELEQAQKHKDIFIAQMSHEMRTPMNAICGVTELLSANYAPAKKELISILSKSSTHLLNIINDILDLSKLQNGKFQVQVMPYMLDELIQDVYSYAKKGCDEKNLQFNLSINAVQNLHLLGDPYRIKQILNNILSNAIKFTDKGAVDFWIEYDKTRACVVYTIKDTGIGMTEDEIKKIFTPFSQANETIHIKYGGTGIGLCISRQLAEIFGGTIVLESQYGQGTVFTVTIPVQLYDQTREYTTAGRVAVSVAVLNSLKNLDILLAEDNEVNRIIFTELIRADLPEIKITTAADGEEAIHWLEKKKFDVVLMDIQMPKMDGLTATRIIRRHTSAAIKNIPVIALSAYARKSEVNECMEAGMNGYLSKPLNKNEFFFKVYEVLGFENNEPSV